ncbi:MAG: hypothetical protein ACTHM1_05185 [Solirubrobacteraceae bacterium]
MTDERTPVRIAPDDPETASLWGDLGRLAAQVLPAEWTLVGGLMVQLLAFEAGETAVRATTDIDILGDVRQRASVEKIAQALHSDGLVLEPPSPTDGISHRWRRGSIIVDLLAPDGLRGDPPMLGGVRTIQIPGGSQALARTETVEVEIDGAIVQVRRPTLLGALLVKARSILVHADPDAQRADLVLLLALIEDPRATAEQLKGREQSWLRKCEVQLGLDDPVLMAPFPRVRVRRARLAYRLLVA